MQKIRKSFSNTGPIKLPTQKELEERRKQGEAIVKAFGQNPNVHEGVVLGGGKAKSKTATSKPKTATSKSKTATSKSKTATSKSKTAVKPKTTTSKPQTRHKGK